MTLLSVNNIRSGLKSDITIDNNHKTTKSRFILHNVDVTISTLESGLFSTGIKVHIFASTSLLWVLLIVTTLVTWWHIRQVRRDGSGDSVLLLWWASAWIEGFCIAVMSLVPSCRWLWELDQFKETSLIDGLKHKCIQHKSIPIHAARENRAIQEEHAKR